MNELLVEGFNKEGVGLMTTNSGLSKIYEYRGRRQTRNERRFRDMDGVLEEAGLLRRKKIGRGELLYLPDCHAVNEFLVERLSRRGDYLFASCAEPLDNFSAQSRI